MARMLEAEGERTTLVVLINSWPANRGHDRLRWTPGSLLKFLGNLAHWAGRMARWPAGTRRRFLQWKVRTLGKRIAGWLRPGAAAGGIDLLIDLSATPLAERQLWEAHWRALQRYQPQPYGDTVALLRTRGYPLFSSFDYGHGWDALARGGVSVRLVPGTHETLLSEPHVGPLARALEAQLGSAPAPERPLALAS